MNGMEEAAGIGGLYDTGSVRFGSDDMTGHKTTHMGAFHQSAVGPADDAMVSREQVWITRQEISKGLHSARWPLQGSSM